MSAGKAVRAQSLYYGKHRPFAVKQVFEPEHHCRARYTNDRNITCVPVLLFHKEIADQKDIGGHQELNGPEKSEDLHDGYQPGRGERSKKRKDAAIKLVFIFKYGFIGNIGEGE